MSITDRIPFDNLAKFSDVAYKVLETNALPGSFVSKVVQQVVSMIYMKVIAKSIFGKMFDQPKQFVDFFFSSTHKSYIKYQNFASSILSIAAYTRISNALFLNTVFSDGLTPLALGLHSLTMDCFVTGTQEEGIPQMPSLLSALELTAWGDNIKTKYHLLSDKQLENGSNLSKIAASITKVASLAIMLSLGHNVIMAGTIASIVSVVCKVIFQTAYLAIQQRQALLEQEPQEQQAV